MSRSDAVIRLYKHDDDNKLVRFMVAKAAMEPLAVANRKATTHPLIISLWAALSCALIQLLGWWPDPRFGIMGYLRPLPAFAVVSLPIMSFIDWYQRSQFEKHSVEALKRPDTANIRAYYTRTPASGFWIYDFGDQFVGLVAVDASTDSLTSQTAQDPENDRSRSRSRGKTSACKTQSTGTAVIRHLYVTPPYRAANAQDDLVAFAVRRTFETSSNVDRIRATPSPLLDYLGQSLRHAGFEVVGKAEKVGIFGWTTPIYELTRDKWENLQKDRVQ